MSERFRPAGPTRRTVPPGRPDAVPGTRRAVPHLGTWACTRTRSFPHAINLALRGGEFAGPRTRAAAGLDGEMLEIGGAELLVRGVQQSG